MIYIQIPTLLNNWNTTTHVVDKTTDRVDERAVNRIVDKLMVSGKISENMASDREALYAFVNSYRLKSFPDGRVKSSQKDVWLTGTDLDVKVDARDLVVIAKAYNVNGR